MINYYKYLPTSSEDEKWGMHVLDAGCNRINPSEIYPSRNHPEHHYFNWYKGRILKEYQIIYVTRGEGFFESDSSQKKAITAGTLILLFPDEWHRFKPNPQTGWDEFWVGFKGTIMEQIVKQEFFHPKNAIWNIGVHEKIINLLIEIIEITKEEKTGYQPLVSGIVLHLLGQVHALAKQRNYKKEDITESIMNRARIIFRTNLDQPVSIKKVAAELNVSYAWFRKAFKAFTGIAPNQYLLQLKIEKAKMLLSENSGPIKEISYALNFESAFYFSKLFKEKTGMSPERFRKMNRE
jgi:AraC-like DNA-binding protein